MSETKSNLKDTKKIFFKKGPCSSAFFYILNREFSEPKEAEEKAAEPLAGGIMQTGHQCGMLWGAVLAAGLESHRSSENENEAIKKALNASQSLINSFSETAKCVTCRDITKSNWKSPFGWIKYFVTGKIFKCINLAKKWAPKAIKSASEGLSKNIINSDKKSVSCASELAKRMNADEEKIATVAGFAGGIGLSGNACGALSAAIWLKSMEWTRETGKAAWDNPYAKKIIEAFNLHTESETLCEKITGGKFKSIENHTKYINEGGCEKLIKILAQS